MLPVCVCVCVCVCVRGGGCRCWADGVVPAEDDYSKGSLRAAMQEKDWNSLGMGMSLIGIANFAD